VDALAAIVPNRYRALMYVLAYGGLRWAEAVGLRLEHINLLRRRIVIAETLSEVNGRLYPVAPKTWESRTIAIPPFVADILGEDIGWFTTDRENRMLFTTNDGTPLRSSNFRRWVWNPALTKLGEEGLRVYDLGHTCASLLIAAGAHPGLVRDTSATRAYGSPWTSTDTSTRTSETRSPNVWNSNAPVETGHGMSTAKGLRTKRIDRPAWFPDNGDVSWIAGSARNVVRHIVRRRE
jgi:integrase